MSKVFLVSMYFSYVSNSGGVIDVAKNLVIGFEQKFKGRFSVAFPSNNVRHPKLRTLMRFLADIGLSFRYYFSNRVLLFPNYFCIPLPWSRSKSVVVVHDLMFKHYPQYVNPIKRLIFNVNYKLVQRYVDGVIFISKDSQEDFIKIYGEPRKYTYIYNPVIVDEVPQAIVRNVGPSAETPYIIANFHYYPHKNLGKLLDVFSQIHAGWPELRLVFTGNKPQEFDNFSARCSAHSAIMHLGFLPKEQVMALIRDAKFFMSMSKFEGFNMSAAEAGLLGKPLVLSDIPVHRELFSSGAYLLDLNSADVDVDAIIAFVKGHHQAIPDYAKQVRPDVVAAKYVKFIDEVSSC